MESAYEYSLFVLGFVEETIGHSWSVDSGLLKIDTLRMNMIDPNIAMLAARTSGCNLHTIYVRMDMFRRL